MSIDTNKVIEYAMKRSERMNEMDSGMVQVKEPEKEVPSLMNRLDERLSILDKELESLAVQLVPIMPEIIKDDYCVERSNQPGRCELAADLDSKLNIIEGLIQKIGSMRSRIEL